jgi:hypothetical protein
MSMTTGVQRTATVADKAPGSCWHNQEAEAKSLVASWEHGANQLFIQHTLERLAFLEELVLKHWGSELR